MDGLTAHRQSLRDQHEKLDRLIEAEQRRPSPDSVLIHDLKKQKLALKEQIEA